VRDERRLDLERADPVARRDDDVVRAALEVQEAVVVARDAVARAPRAARRGLAGVAEKERRHGRRIDDELAVIDRQADAGQRASHRARPDLLARSHARQLSGLGLAIAVADRKARRLLPRAQHLGVERLAGGDEAAQIRARAQRCPLGDHAVLRRRHAQHADALS